MCRQAAIFVVFTSAKVVDMKKWKIVIIVIATIVQLSVMLAFFAGVGFFLVNYTKNPITIARHPNNQPGTTWVSQDGSVRFTIREDKVGEGTLIHDGKTVCFVLVEDMAVTMMLCDPVIYSNDGIRGEDIYEKWICHFYSKDKFVATVIQTTYFSEGQRIIFCKYQP